MMTKIQIKKMGYQIKEGFYKRNDIYVWGCPKGYAMGRMKDRLIVKVTHFTTLEAALKAGRNAN